MSSTAQKKKRTTRSPLVFRSSAKTSRRVSTRRTANASRAADASRVASRTSNGDLGHPTETIDVMDSVEEVVDLTYEASESAVVDLTNNDSVLLVDEGPENDQITTTESYIVSSDEDEEAGPVLNSNTSPSVHPPSSSRSTPGTISCPICLDSYSEIVDSGRLVVSTKCGHVFCSRCLRDALTSSHTCPTCRKRLTHRQYHPLYV